MFEMWYIIIWIGIILFTLNLILSAISTRYFTSKFYFLGSIFAATALIGMTGAFMTI